MADGAFSFNLIAMPSDDLGQKVPSGKQVRSQEKSSSTEKMPSGKKIPPKRVYRQERRCFKEIRVRARVQGIIYIILKKVVRLQHPKATCQLTPLSRTQYDAALRAT